MDASTTVRRALQDALALVLPVSCAGCGADDVALCDGCRLGLRPQVTRRTIDGVDVWSGLGFASSAARVIRSMKEEGRTGLARDLAPALAAAYGAVAGAAGALLVPVPTSRASYRRRGFRVAELVARRAGLPVTRLIRPTRETADQRGLDVAERRSNVDGSLLARRGGGAVLLLDDVVTTGATLAEAIRALRAGGSQVIGAVTIAATPRRDRAANQTHR